MRRRLADSAKLPHGQPLPGPEPDFVAVAARSARREKVPPPLKQLARAADSSCWSSCAPPKAKSEYGLIRNDDGPVARRHLRSFRVPYHQPDQIRARFDVKARFHRETRAAEAIQGRIEQAHLYNLLSTGHKIAIFIKNRGGKGEIVAAAPFCFAKVNSLHIDARQHRQPRLRLIGLKKLRLQVDRYIVNFFLRKNRLLDFLLGGLRGILDRPWRVVAAARLNGELLLAGQRYFQDVVVTVHFQILRREG